MEWMVIVLYGRGRNEKGVTQGNSKAVTWANIYVSWWGLGAAERSYPTSEVRGRSREDPMPDGRWPRGITPRPRSGAAAESARLQQHKNGREELPKSEVSGGGREELPRVRGQGRRPGEPTPHPQSGGCMGAGGPRGAISR